MNDSTTNARSPADRAWRCSHGNRAPDGEASAAGGDTVRTAGAGSIAVDIGRIVTTAVLAAAAGSAPSWRLQTFAFRVSNREPSFSFRGRGSGRGLSMSGWKRLGALSTVALLAWGVAPTVAAAPADAA